ncbi:outer membrane lipoprotein LolB [Colwellia chukchiensis]|uniref:Outer-membrane lipoprotein LolB n=1 Tax=Colwellia chukchiensis TaxID=641665 RepID=A0A1H7GCX1_9GAMM|nr:lipoprotein insertase outer membrane protein LolB [Colwellia chukchiensis]SEK35958.1 outer membrane lipoprotein LolB [Colwellia chukchiensis]
MYYQALISLFFIIIVSACTSINDKPVTDNFTSQDINSRNQQLSQLDDWTIVGKIAFISNEKRESASLHWQKNSGDNTESLNLSTVFGIKLLAITKQDKLFNVVVDGQQYQTNDLDNLIYQLTGLNLPTRAMSHWLKGLAYLPSDEVTYHAKTQLPETLRSVYNQQHWQIKYSKYHHIGNFQLAKQLSISQDDLRIKIIIHSWHI